MVISREAERISLVTPSSFTGPEKIKNLIINFSAWLQVCYFSCPQALLVCITVSCSCRSTL